MKKYADVVIGPVSGSPNAVLQPIVGASVQILGHVSQANATIYSDDGVTTTTNPLTTDSQGRYQFYVANGRYDIKISAPGFTTFTLSDIDIHDETDITVPGETPLPGNLIFTGTNSHSGAETFTGTLNSNSLAVGNVANKNATGDNITYLSASGNDSNDGLSWGTAKGTLAGCVSSLNSGLGGTCYATGNQTITSQVNIGNVNGVTPSAIQHSNWPIWTVNITSGGSACGFNLYSYGSLAGVPESGSAHGLQMVPSGASANMDSMVCNTGTGSNAYHNVSDTFLFNSVGATFGSALLHINNFTDGSAIRNVRASNFNGLGALLNSMCCESFTFNLTGNGNGGAGAAGVSWTGNTVYSPNFGLAHTNPGSGKNIYSVTGGNSCAGFSVFGQYAEVNVNNGDTTTPIWNMACNFGAQIFGATLHVDVVPATTRYLVASSNTNGFDCFMCSNFGSGNVINDTALGVTVITGTPGVPINYISHLTWLQNLRMIRPQASQNVDLGSTTTPFQNLWLQGGGGGNYELGPASTARNIILNLVDYGGGANQHVPWLVLLTAAYTNATTTFSTITDGTRSFSFPVQGQFYDVSCKIYFQGSATTAGPKFQVTGPGASTMAMSVGPFDPITKTTTNVVTATSTANTTFGTIGALGVNYEADVNIGFSSGGAGTLVLQAAANGAGTLTIQAGSFCVIQ